MRINSECFFDSNLSRNGFLGLTPDLESFRPRCNVCQFSGKTYSFDFFSPNLPKTDLGLEIQKTNDAIRINILEIPSVPVFRQSGQLWHFRPKFAPKLILVSEFQKSKFGFRISTSKIPCEWILKMDNFEFICLNLGKLSNYMGYFHSNNVEWSWLEEAARFSNTRY